MRDLRRRRGENRLTVGIDISPFWEPLTGIGWYVFRLLEAFADRKDLAVRLYGPDLVDPSLARQIVVEPPTGPAIERVSCAPPRTSGVALSSVMGFLARLLAPILLAADGNRVLFAPNYFPPRSWLLAEARDTPLVATIHDLSYLRVPWAVRDETRDDLERHLNRVWSRASRILTDCDAVRYEIIHAGLASPERVTAIHLAAVQQPGRSDGSPLDSRRPYGLFVGTVEPRKNLQTLLQAWRGLRRTLPTPPELVICGRLGWKAERVAREIERAQAEGWLHHYGYVDAGELATLYRHALLLALPSHYEGFGLPILEAFDAGVPLVVSDLPVLREVAGDAAVYAPPERPDLWQARLAEVLVNQTLRDELIRCGQARARRFSWQQTGDATLEALHEAADRG